MNWIGPVANSAQPARGGLGALVRAKISWPEAVSSFANDFGRRAVRFFCFAGEPVKQVRDHPNPRPADLRALREGGVA